MKFLAWLLITFSAYCSPIVIVTVTIGENYKKCTMTGVVSKYLYCQKHGYDFYVLDHSLDPSRPHPWSKIKIVQELLKTHQYVFWSDADSLIMNQNLRLEELIDFEAPEPLHVCYDHISSIVNTGQFLLSQGEKTDQFLNEVYACTYAIHHGWWENRAIVDLLATARYSGFAKIYPQRSFNSFGNGRFKRRKQVYFKKGDFIVHFPCTPVAELKKIMEYVGRQYQNGPKIEYNQLISF